MLLYKKRSVKDFQTAYGLSGGNRTHSLSLRRRLRYPITLRKDFNVLKVISRYEKYQFYTTILHVLNEKHNILRCIDYTILYLGI